MPETFAEELAALINTHKEAGADVADLKLALDAALSDLETVEDEEEENPG